MKTRWLFLVTALAEGGTGLALLVTPSGVAELLLGVGLDSPAALVVGRITGAALVSLSVACWPRDGEPRGQVGLLVGLLIYNAAVPLLLISAALSAALHGVALWPASLLHTALAVWCVLCLALPRRRGAPEVYRPIRVVMNWGSPRVHENGRYH